MYVRKSEFMQVARYENGGHHHCHVDSDEPTKRADDGMALDCCHLYTPEDEPCRKCRCGNGLFLISKTTFACWKSNEACKCSIVAWVLLIVWGEFRSNWFREHVELLRVNTLLSIFPRFFKVTRQRFASCLIYAVESYSGSF